mmetsp:Transcript_413/g.1146  ORF Transcript_413/g.1146 Transcript_413/m.1146 type:complete len:349 (+) Transcript_413:58-1104(+)
MALSARTGNGAAPTSKKVLRARTSVSAQGDSDLTALIAQEGKGVQAPSARGGGLPPCRGATLKSPEPEVECSSRELGRYKTPSLAAKTKGSTDTRDSRRPSEVGAGHLMPTAPTTPHSGRPKGPVRRKSSTHLDGDEVKNLSTRELGVILRRNSGRQLTPNDDSDGDGTPSLPMRKVKSDMPRVDAAPTAEPNEETEPNNLSKSQPVKDMRPVSKQQQLSMLLLADGDKMVSIPKAGTTDNNDGAGESLSAKQKRRLDGRRRSLELQALLNSAENAEEQDPGEVVLSQNDAIIDDKDVQSREDEYWSSMWQITKTAMRERQEADTKDTDDGGLEIKFAEPGLHLLAGF